MAFEHLPPERESITHRFSIDGMDGYLIAGKYPDGRPGELFIYFHASTTERGFAQAMAVMISLAMQHGIPLEQIVHRLKGMRFEPHGLTDNPLIPQTSSIADYAVRWLEMKFPGEAK